MQRPQPFWMVKGEGPSGVQHGTPEAAELEADRLARAKPGKSFYVMQAISCHRKVDVERTDLIAIVDEYLDRNNPF